MNVSVEQFARDVVACGLLAADDVEPLKADLPEGPGREDATELARKLVSAGKLTKYQAANAVKGKAKNLVFGEYVVLAAIGTGGMGQVFKAEHRRMKRVVALKILPPAAVKSPAAVKRFQQEVQAAARLEHPNIVTAHDAGEANGVHFLVMQFVDGRDLASLVAERGPLPVAQAVSYLLEAARGLAYAHGKGIVHRDVKPANLLLSHEGTIKILDMGIARYDGSDQPTAGQNDRVTVSGDVIGTVDFMSPEQAEDAHRADSRADVYSLGCTLFFLLTADSVYQGSTSVQRIVAHREQPIPSLSARRPDVPPPLDRVFARMVAKLPAERFQNMPQVIAALEPFQTVAAATVNAAWAAPVAALTRGPSEDDKTTSPVKKAATLLDHEVVKKTWSMTAKVATALFGTVIAPLVVAIAIKYLDEPPAPNPPAAGKDAAQPAKDAAQPAGKDGQSAEKSDAKLAGKSSPQPKEPAPAKKPPAAAPPDSVASSAKPQSEPRKAPDKAPPKRPAVAVAPFDGDQARTHQRVWGEFLKTPVEQTNSVGMTLVLVPPGEFQMGSTQQQHEGALKMARAGPKANAQQLRSADFELPQHRVRLTRPFLLAATEVTIGQFKKFVAGTKYVTEAEKFGFGNSILQKADKTVTDKDKKANWRAPGWQATDPAPVTEVTWNDAVAFCNWLSEKEHLPVCYRQDKKHGWSLVPAATGYRLPTEAEWEFACRAGTTTHFSFGDDPKNLDKFAWYASNSDSHPHPVARKLPNGFGLYDMHGNVWEWCHDWYTDDYYAHAPMENPLGPDHATARVSRGASVANSPFTCRSAGHGGITPIKRGANHGFRVLRSVSLPGA